MKTFNQTLTRLLLVVLLTPLYSIAGDITFNTYDSQGNPIAGSIRITLGPNNVGTYPSGSTVTLNDGSNYKIWATYKGTSTSRMNYTPNGNDVIDFNTTSITIHFSGGYCDYRSTNSWTSFSRPTMELFPKDFYGNTMKFQIGHKWNDKRYVYKEIDYEGQTSIEKTFAVLVLKGHDGSPLSGGAARGGYSSPSLWHVNGTTDGDGLLLDCRDGNPSQLIYEMRLNNGIQLVGPQNPAANSYYEFETELVTLRLETCDGTPLDGGHPRFGAGNNFGTSHWSNGNTGWSAAGETTAEMFQGTYSFDMEYQGTSEQKIAQNVPDGGASFTWVTTHVTLNYSNSISYGGGSGDARFFNKPSMQLLSGTYKFHFRDGNRVDLTIGGCELDKTAAVVDVNDCNGGHQDHVDIWRYKYGSKNSTLTQVGSDVATPFFDLQDGEVNYQVVYIVNYLKGSNSLQQNPSTNSLYEFNMTTARAELRDVCGDLIDYDGTIKCYAWGSANHKFDITMTDGVAEMCLLPDNYVFTSDYNEGSASSGNHNIASTYIFQTGQVDDGGFSANQYYRWGNAGNPSAFVDGMQLLPGKYGFKNGATLTTNVVAGMTLDLFTNTTAAPNCPAPKSALANTSDSQPEISIYPNPTSSNVTIEAKGEIIIHNLSGKLMYMGGSETIDVSNWAAGLYFIKANGESFKLIVE